MQDTNELMDLVQGHNHGRTHNLRIPAPSSCHGCVLEQDPELQLNCITHKPHEQVHYVLFYTM